MADKSSARPGAGYVPPGQAGGLLLSAILPTNEDSAHVLGQRAAPAAQTAGASSIRFVSAGHPQPPTPTAAARAAPPLLMPAQKLPAHLRIHKTHGSPRRCRLQSRLRPQPRRPSPRQSTPDFLFFTNFSVNCAVILLFHKINREFPRLVQEGPET